MPQAVPRRQTAAAKKGRIMNSLKNAYKLIAVVMLLASFVILFAINLLQWWTSRGYLRTA